MIMEMSGPSSPEEPLPRCLLLGAAVLVAVAMEAFLRRKLNALSNMRQACSRAPPGAARPPVAQLGCAPIVIAGIDMNGPGDAFLLESKRRHSTTQERQKLRRLGKLHSPIVTEVAASHFTAGVVVVAGTFNDSVFAAQCASPISSFGRSRSVTRSPTFSRPPSYDDAWPVDVDSDRIDSDESQSEEYRPDQYARLNRFDRI